MNPAWPVLGLLLICPALWSWGGGHMPARGSAVVLVLLALGSLILILRRRIAVPAPAWLAALLWAWGLLGWLNTPVPDPGWIRVVERGAALVVAWGACAWWLGRGLGGIPGVLGLLGSGILALDVLGQLPAPGTGTTLGLWSGIGLDTPTGNPNFTVGAALPLLVVGLAGWTEARPSQRLALGVGILAATVLGTGALSGDATRAVWPALVAGGGILAILRLPRQVQVPATLLGLMTAFVLPLALAWGGWTSSVIGPSGMYRLALWRSAGQAIAHGPWQGYGPGASLSVLPGQPAYVDAWLAVPSYPEHAHHEFLEALVEGGLPALILLMAVAVVTYLPLWRRRAESVPRALLAGGATALALALVESHLSQPGPLLGLALLGGSAWAVAGAAQGISWPRLGLPVAWAAVAVLLLGRQLGEEARAGDELTGAATPPVVELVHLRALDLARKNQDWPEAARIAQSLQNRLGSLIDVWQLRAEAAAHLGDNPTAVALTLNQAVRLPLVPAHLDVLDRLERRARERQWPDAPALTAARLRARNLARIVVARARSTDHQATLAWLGTWAARE